ncbi:MAG: EAL domain-containing protein [Spirochaetales bacterium]|nr:EAL domain-containing protein [Spirochaetales bacterium]
MRRAIKRNYITPYFQPIYDISRKEITRYECLVRLVDSNQVYTPHAFLKIS